jgi:hypothetical protein
MASIGPKCLAVIICESVVEDLRTRNKSILNAYNVISAPKFPTTHDRMTVFVSLTEGRGPADTRFVLLRDSQSGQEQILEVRGKVKFPNPVAVVDLVVDLRNVPVPGPGPYAMQVWVDDELVGERRVVARQMPTREVKP